MAEELARLGDIDICHETFGSPDDPAMLLVMGLGTQMIAWPEPFCRRLADRGFFVIRYDNRDTGRSTGYEPGKAAYTLDDLAGDAVGVLDGYDIERAHLVGMSLGGGIAQLVALGHPKRVASVTAISTTKVGEPDPSLPKPDASYMDHAAAFEELDWSDTRALADLIVRDARQLAGSKHPFDEAAARELVEHDLERANNPQSLMNHGMLGGGQTERGRPREIDVPVLVIHGSADPILPHPHGVALAEAVDGAELVTLEGGGHELNPGDWDQILDAILSHTGKR